MFSKDFKEDRHEAIENNFFPIILGEQPFTNLLISSRVRGGSLAVLTFKRVRVILYP